MRTVLRTYWRSILLSIAAPVVAIFFFWPAKAFDGPALAGEPPLWRYAEVKVDRIQPLPWTTQDKGHILHSRFALGWIGDRALLIESAPQRPTELTLHGYLRALSGDQEHWVDETPQVASACYRATLDMTSPYVRTLLQLGSALVSLAMLGVWGYRWRRRNLPLAERAETKLGTALDVPPPRSDELVHAVLFRHATLVFVAWFAVYALTVWALAGVITADSLGFDLFGPGSTLRAGLQFALGCAVSAPAVVLPFAWWVRRRRRELAHVARHGTIIDGEITKATLWGTRGTLLFWRFTPRSVDMRIAVIVDGSVRLYRAKIGRTPEWAAPGGRVRVLATADSRDAVVIVPSGDDIIARRLNRPRGRRPDLYDNTAGLPKASLVTAASARKSP